MATLTSQTIAGTYKDLLKIDATSYQAGVVSALRKVEDGDATPSALSIGTTSIAIDATDKFYLDGGTHTYFSEVSGGDKIEFVVGGERILELREAGGGTSDYIAIQAENKLFFDGGFNTYISETDVDTLDFVCGSRKMFTLDYPAEEVVVNEGSNIDVDFRVESNGSEHALFVDAGLNKVGIKQDVPLGTLHINSDGGNMASVNSGVDDLILETAGSDCGMTIYSGGTTNNGSIYFASDNGINEGNIYFTHNADNDVRMLQFGFGASFATGVTFLGSGNFGIGLAAPTSTLHVKAADTTATASCAHFECTESDVEVADVLVRIDFSGDADVDAARAISFHDSGGEIGSVTLDADATSFNTSSDYRLKTDLKDIPDATGIINQLKLYDFAWKKNTSKRLTGVIAHEAAEIVPYAVTGEKDAMITDIVTPSVRAVEAKDAILDDDGNVIEEAVEAVEAADEVTEEVISAQGTDYSKFVPLLLKSIQELSAKVDALESA